LAEMVVQMTLPKHRSAGESWCTWHRMEASRVTERWLCRNHAQSGHAPLAYTSCCPQWEASLCSTASYLARRRSATRACISRQVPTKPKPAHIGLTILGRRGGEGH
jgi:hypothetical protein